MQYLVFEYQKEYDHLFNKYDHLKEHLCNLKEENSYIKELKSSMYRDVDFLNKIIFQKLIHRKEYVRKGSLHTLYNQLTNEKMTFEIKNNIIYINSSNKNNIFFYIIYQNLEKYVIIEKNL